MLYPQSHGQYRSIQCINHDSVDLSTLLTIQNIFKYIVDNVHV